MPEPILSSLFSGAYAVFVIMFLFWLSQVFTKNAGVIDIGWALGLAVLTAIYTFKLDGYKVRQLILLCMVSLWALRLSILLVRRIIRSMCRRSTPNTSFGVIAADGAASDTCLLTAVFLSSAIFRLKSEIN